MKKHEKIKDVRNMEERIEQFINYIKIEKRASYNTWTSYERDLRKATLYFEEMGIKRVEEITATSLTSYLLYLEKEGFSAATISRKITVLKKFFQYLIRIKRLEDDPTERLQSPKVERREVTVLTQKEMEQLLEQPSSKTPKGIRDRAMLELLYTTGIRISELIQLKEENINLELGYLICVGEKQNRILSFDKMTKEVLGEYRREGRPKLLKEENDIFFLNRSGLAMTRQGVWKNIKAYAKKAGIEKEITPHILKNSFALHLLQNGMEFQQLQQLMGPMDLSAIKKNW